jgi:ribonuclease G
MPKELIISANAHEKKVAIVEDGVVTEFYVERQNENTGVVGNIYKGRVMKVLPGMQSAFVDIGLERDAFLYVSDFLDLEDETFEFKDEPGEKKLERAERAERPERAERAERAEAAKRIEVEPEVDEDAEKAAVAEFASAIAEAAVTIAEPSEEEEEEEDTAENVERRKRRRRRRRRGLRARDAPAQATICIAWSRVVA